MKCGKGHQTGSGSLDWPFDLRHDGYVTHSAEFVKHLLYAVTVLKIKSFAAGFLREEGHHLIG